jgi:uncharacterized membrane protein affecting hemolysin expression
MAIVLVLRRLYQGARRGRKQAQGGASRITRNRRVKEEGEGEEQEDKIGL